ncbi:hypothetical protein [Pelagicoccus mobilis]|uniref:Uncharacterized protein n=1 Tax=Pelagicoccus mobilis TaxID=415221 RepID=A0A934VTZ2_9BACT|nr:hypothetical protein [Pelagicoccus mobilis]MBK1880223.1 hypothetical protein [Pelagicoccus mobilis]
MRDLLTGDEGIVSESARDYGIMNPAYIDDLSEVLKKVGEFLEEQNRNPVDPALL